MSGAAKNGLLLSMCAGLLVGTTAATAALAHDAADEARVQLAAGQPARAIAPLKQAVERQPLRKELRLWLARAYLADGNEFWALRTLNETALLHPEDCHLPLWQAYVQLRQGALDQARALLEPPCAGWPPLVARRALLLAMLEQGAGANERARVALAQAHDARFAFPEDRAAIAQLQAQLAPGFLSPFSGRLDLALGGTSNARAGSPVDPASQGNSARSLAVSATGTMRFVSPHAPGGWARLSVEAEGRGIGYQSATGRDFSYLQLGGRPGVLLEAWGKRMLLGYRYEALLLAGGDRYDAGPLWFSEAHRGEWELELSPALTFFAGSGWRGFRERGRSRVELDGGVGGGLPISARVHLMAALSGRFHDARNDAYDLRGVSLLLSAEQRWQGRWTTRAGVLLSADDYPRSAGYFDPQAATVGRRDLMLRLSLSGFSPPSRDQIKLGLTYELGMRDSTAERYDYTDHRVLAKVIWTFSADPWLPHPATPVAHVPIDYGLAAAEVGERIQDLLRQSEATHRSSSCRE